MSNACLRQQLCRFSQVSWEKTSFTTVPSDLFEIQNNDWSLKTSIAYLRPRPIDYLAVCTMLIFEKFVKNLKI